MPHPVKVYERPPDRKVLPMVYIAIAVIAVLVLGYFLYKTMTHPTQASAPMQASSPTQSTTVILPQCRSYLALSQKQVVG